jgi:hypothetical protein
VPRGYSIALALKAWQTGAGLMSFSRRVLNLNPAPSPLRANLPTAPGYPLRRRRSCGARLAHDHLNPVPTGNNTNLLHQHELSGSVPALAGRTVSVLTAPPIGVLVLAKPQVRIAPRMLPAGVAAGGLLLISPRYIQWRSLRHLHRAARRSQYPLVSAP